MTELQKKLDELRSKGLLKERTVEGVKQILVGNTSKETGEVEWDDFWQVIEEIQ